MCMLFIADNSDAADDEYALVVLSIRDEQYNRNTRECQQWQTNPSVYGGMDLQDGLEGGTWLAIDTAGNKIGAVLRVLQPFYHTSTSTLTRGFLVTNFMKSKLSGAEYIASVVPDAHKYPGFNLVTIDVNAISSKHNKQHNTISYLNNTTDATPTVSTCRGGIWAFGNSAPKEPFVKTKVGRDHFADITARLKRISERDLLCAQLFALASDDTAHFPDPVLAKDGAGFPDEYLRGLSSINCRIPMASFGTRTQTIILIDRQGNCDWIERNLSADNLHVRGVEWPVRTLSFKMNIDAANDDDGDDAKIRPIVSVMKSNRLPFVLARL